MSGMRGIDKSTQTTNNKTFSLCFYPFRQLLVFISVVVCFSVSYNGLFPIFIIVWCWITYNWNIWTVVSHIDIVFCFLVWWESYNSCIFMWTDFVVQVLHTQASQNKLLHKLTDTIKHIISTSIYIIQASIQTTLQLNNKLKTSN